MGTILMTMGRDPEQFLRKLVEWLGKGIEDTAREFQTSVTEDQPAIVAIGYEIEEAGFKGGPPIRLTVVPYLDSNRWARKEEFDGPASELDERFGPFYASLIANGLRASIQPVICRGCTEEKILAHERERECGREVECHKLLLVRESLMLSLVKE